MLSIKYLYCNREFELTNHLGNVQVTISDKRIRIPNPNNNQQTAYYLPEVLTTTDYYPFGMQMPARTFSATAGVTYKFGFNGKEKVNEVITGLDGTHLDFGARVYDSRIGRWMSTEPLFKEYPSLSLYIYCNNNPIHFVDKDGKDIWVGFEATHDNHAGHTTIMYTTYKEVQVNINGVMTTMYQREGIAVTEHNQYNIRNKTMGDYQNWESNNSEDVNRENVLISKQDTKIKINTATGTLIEGVTYYTKAQVQLELDLRKFAQKKENENKGKETFNLVYNNCTDYAAEVLKTLGINTNGREKIYVAHKSGVIESVANPNSLFKWMKEQITKGKKPDWKVEKESNAINEDPKPTMQNY